MKRMSGLPSALSLGVAEHVQGDSPADVQAGLDAIDRLLHLSVAAIAAFDGIGGRRQQGIIQEGQRFFQGGREEFLQCLAKALEAMDASPESGQLGHSGLGPAAAVEQAVRFIDDLPQDTKAGLTPSDPTQGVSLGLRQVVLDEQVAVIEQIGDPGLDAFFAGRQLAVGPRGAAPADVGQRGLQLPANLGHGLEDGLVQFGQNVELADLMADRTEYLDDGPGIQRRSIGGNALQAQPMGFQGILEPREEPCDVLLGRVVVEDFVDQAFEPVVVHDGQHAVGPVVQFVGGDVAGEVGQGLIQVALRDAFGGPFFPPPPPSSGSWQRGRRHGGLAISARKPTDTAGRPRPPVAQPGRRHGGCSGCGGRPSPTGRR
jgi:hypothetical protein